MEIIKYKKKKNNIYEVEFNDLNVVELYDDVIIKYDLLLNKSISPKNLNDIIEYNTELSAYYDALKYIAKKLRAKKEIEVYLKKKEFSQNVINITIDKLSNEGYLDSKIFITSYINDNHNFNNHGPIKLKNNLLNLGFNIEDIETYLNFDYSDKLISIIEKKVKSNSKLNTNALKLSLTKYLLDLGYPRDSFNDHISTIKIDSSDMIKKDYAKYFIKYKNKYKDFQLQNFISAKLYQKGYNSDEINEVINENGKFN